MSKDVGGQQDDRFDETESPFDGHAGQTEWEQEEPHKGIQNQRCQGKRPTKKKQYEPKKKFCHVIPPFLDYDSSGRRLRSTTPFPTITR